MLIRTVTKYFFLATVTLIIIGGTWFYIQLNNSLAILSGKIKMPGLSQSVSIQRDQIGTVTLIADNRLDIAHATGFVHAQDRFFQMDLLRRQAAGELAELFGQAALSSDQTVRIHRFRQHANEAFSNSPPTIKALLIAYTAGVNEGLRTLKSAPIEYLLLRSSARPWQQEDSFLVLYAMFLELQDSQGRFDQQMGLLRDTLPAALFQFLTPSYTPWDAPINKMEEPKSVIPDAVDDFLDGIHHKKTASKEKLEHFADSPAIGSNNWAVSGALTDYDSALLAGDMHLPLRIPNTWYRLRMQWSSDDEKHDITGVTIPGSPLMIVGSNRAIAWAFTNSYGDWSDIIELDLAGENAELYQTKNGTQKFETFHELITVKNQTPIEFNYRYSKWGPVLAEGRQQTRVLRWVAHFSNAVNMNLLYLENANNVSNALNIANTIGIPAQNIIITDKQGNLGWSIAGIMPKRSSSKNETRTPISWAEAEDSWQTWLEPQHYPRVINPASHRLWTANSRVIAGDEAYKIGDGGLVLGARSTQIRNRLLAGEKFNENDLLAIQLDDRALFLDRWQHFIFELLSANAVDQHPKRQQFLQLIKTWTGHASTESVAYRLVRAYRVFMAEKIFKHIMNPAIDQDNSLNPLFYKRYEAPLWQLVNEQPIAYLPKEFTTWEALLLAGVDDVIDYFESKKIPLEKASWGQRNTLAMAHPLSLAVPLLSPLVDAVAVPLPGDRYLPRVQGPDFGASIRFVVAPGHEENGILQLPAGQSGHPLSPFYMAGHNDWLTGKATPFLPGKTQYTLTLTPQ